MNKCMLCDEELDMYNFMFGYRGFCSYKCSHKASAYFTLFVVICGFITYLACGGFK